MARPQNKTVRISRQPEDLRWLADWREFTLYACDNENGEWRNFKLVRMPGKWPKHNWWLGWNGKRLAGSRDAVLLAEHHPQAYAWVRQTLWDMDKARDQS